MRPSLYNTYISHSNKEKYAIYQSMKNETVQNKRLVSNTTSNCKINLRTYNRFMQSLNLK